MTIATLVMYHVVRPASGLAAALKGPDEAAFRGQLEYIRAHYTPVGILDLADAAEAGRSLPPRPLVLTFDDGYAGHYDIVFPLLRELQIPAAFFPVAASMLGGSVLDVNKIQLMLTSSGRVDAVDIVLGAIERAIDADVGNGGARREDYRSRWWKSSRWDPAPIVYVKRLLQHALPERVRRPLVDELFRRFVSADEKAVARELYLTADQAREMCAAGMVVGGHGDRHLRLSTLPRDEQAAEIDGALRVLDAVGLPRRGFAYNYANGDYDAQSVDLLASRGCRIAVTTRPELARVRREELLTLPRIDTNDLPVRREAEPNEWTRRAGAAPIAP